MESVLRLMEKYVVLVYDCISADLFSNFGAFPEYVYYINVYLSRCPNKRHFHRLWPISHVQRLIILDVVMICLIISYLSF